MLGAMNAPTRSAQRAQLAGAFGGTTAIIAVGRGAPALVFIPLVAGTFAAYALLVWSLARAVTLTPRTLVVACVALMIVAIAVPVRSSTDVYASIMSGRIVAQHHATAYPHVLGHLPRVPAL